MSPRLVVELIVPLRAFRLEAAFETDATTVGLFGPSGAGKTTLLEAIAGLRRGASGRVAFGGETWLDTAARIDRPPEARRVGYVPQDGLLFPHWDARRNILAGAGRPRRDGGSRVDPERVVEVLDLGPLLGRPVETLSGGERQRVALARALCSGPSLLLLDEPLGSVEAALRARILPYLLEVRDAFRIPTLFVSHDATETAILCEEVVALRRGRVEGRGRPADILAARADLHEGPGGYENVLEGVVTEVAGGRAQVAIAGGHPLILAGAPEAAPGARAFVGVRATDLMLAVAGTEGLSARNVIPGTVRRVRSAEGGAIVDVSIDGGDASVVVRITEPAREALGIAPGRPVRLLLKATACRLLALR